MKLLFICGAFVKDGALSCRSWVQGIISLLSSEFEVTVLSVNCTDASATEAAVGDKTVRLVPTDRWFSPALLSAVAEEEKADVIVIFGTENRRSFISLQHCKDAGLLDKTVMFAQGIAKACAIHYAEGVPSKVIRRWLPRDIALRKNIRGEQKVMEQRAVNEERIISTARNFIGRTTMDKAVIGMIHPDAAYYRCNDVLRGAFYEGTWRYDACEKHRIFVSQYYYPLKGFHFLLEAASMIKDKYPDIVIAAAGYNPIRGSSVKNDLKDSSYIRWIKALIRGYGLENHIEFLGQLNEEEMKQQYLKANVFALPSTIENSPNSLAEAMMLGVPCISSDVGGVSDFADHRRDAYLYPATASYLLAHYLDKVFADPEGAAALGANAKKRAERDYDRKANIQTLQTIFRTVAGKS